ncbi:MAG: PsbP-related protein [Candidatus Gracilibacteria bacterium]
MKKITTILLSAALILSVLSLTACVQKEEGRYYYEDKYSFSIEVPDSWSTSEGLMGTTVAIMSPLEGAEDIFSDNVTITTEELPMIMSLDDYFKVGVAAAGAMLDNYKASETTKVTINDKEALWFTYAYTMGEQDLESIAYIVIDGTVAYLIGGSSLAADYDKYQETFKKICESFRLE